MVSFARHDAAGDTTTGHTFSAVDLSMVLPGDTIVLALTSEGNSAEGLNIGAVTLDPDTAGPLAATSFSRVPTNDGVNNVTHGHIWATLWQAVVPVGAASGRIIVTYSGGSTRRGMSVFVYVLRNVAPAAKSNSRTNATPAGAGTLVASTSLEKGDLAIGIIGVTGENETFTVVGLTESAQSGTIGNDNDSSGAVGYYIAANRTTLNLGWDYSSFNGAATLCIGVWATASK